MSSINQRIAVCIEDSGLTKTAFAKRINISQPHISNIVRGEVGVSDRTISDICREFGVSEVWLRTGEGPMKIQMSEDAEFINIMAQIQVSDDRIKEALKLYWNLPAEKKAVIWELVDQLAKK